MAWIRCTFAEGVKYTLSEFDRSPGVQSLALVWRSGGEYNIMDSWLLKQIMSSMDEKTLRVVLWLTREEASELIALFQGSK